MSYVVGVTGRSGSGKTTLVKNLLSHFGPHNITLHTMDNYYRPRGEQYVDANEYKKFDLPTSFQRENFYEDLRCLQRGEAATIEEYVFNNKTKSNELIIDPAPIIIVEGLFVLYYEEVREMMNLKVLVDVSHETCFDRRLRRDTQERGYTAEEVTYRYTHHVEPSFIEYIEPYRDHMDVIISNEHDMEEDKIMLIERLSQYL